MTSADLRHIVGAMTKNWTLGPLGLDLYSPDYTEREVAAIQLREDAIAIVTLANHADALVGLVEAVERMHTPSIPYAVLQALAAVQAIKGSPLT